MAELHAGCFDDDSVTDPGQDPVVGLWSRVSADPDAAALLARLDAVRAALIRLASLPGGEIGG